MGGEMPRAIESFERSLQVEPDHANALFMLGMALHFTGQACEAIPHLRASIEINPNYPPAQERLSLALNDCGADAATPRRDD